MQIETLSKNETKYRRYEQLRAQLDMEFIGFKPSYQDCATYLLPTYPQFLLDDNNRGDRRNLSILDSTASNALEVLTAGMMSGVTSPARPFFKLTTPDPDLSEVSGIKNWLYVVDRRMHTVLLKSNFYDTMKPFYKFLAGFGIAAFMVEEDMRRVVKFVGLPLGSYRIIQDKDGRVIGIFREFRKTVRQLVEEFTTRDANGNPSWSNFSLRVKNAWEGGKREEWVEVCHVIMPNDEYQQGKVDAKRKRYTSCYYEKGLNPQNLPGEKETFLRESGYDRFPVFVARWFRNPDDIYATDWPALQALGDIKQLQAMEKKALKALDKMIDPPLQASDKMTNKSTSLLPGDVTYVDNLDQHNGVRPIHEVNVNFPLQAMELKEDRVRVRIRETFHADLFQMMSTLDQLNPDGQRPTATEINVRLQEKMDILGPILEQLNSEVFDPLIDLIFEFMVNQGLIPEPPQELEGEELKVEYISIMAQAQKLAGLAGIERLTAFTERIAKFDPSILDKVDTAQMIDEISNILSVPPAIIRSDQDVAAMREQRQKAQMAQVEAEALNKVSGAAKNLAGADMSGKNALTELLGQTPSAVPAA